MFKPTMLAGILKLLPDSIVRRAVSGHDADRWRKSFRTRDQLVAMLAAQLSGAKSLRGVEALFSAHASRLYHLGCAPVRRSTLAHANASRGSEVFAAIAAALIQSEGRAGRDAADIMAALDSTPVRIDGRGSQWADKTFIRAGSQGLKLHLRIGAGSAAAEWMKITDMNVNDITAARDMPLEEGRIYLFDKGYCDYNWWAGIIDAGAHFITRLKRNAAYEVVMERPCDGKDILSDRIIRLTNHSPRGGKRNLLAGRLLRLVQVPHPAGRKQPFVIVSSLLEAPAGEIAEGYRRRWSIELVFKWLKQNLRIKRFLGESRNAIMTQIYVAIIAYVLVRKYHRLSASGTRRMRLADFMTLLVSSLFHPHPQPAIPKPPPSTNQLPLWEAAA